MDNLNLTPELFSPAQINFLRHLGVRVEYLGSNQIVFNDQADKFKGEVLELRKDTAFRNLLLETKDLLEDSLDWYAYTPDHFKDKWDGPEWEAKVQSLITRISRLLQENKS